MKRRFKNILAVGMGILFLLPYLGVVYYALPRNDEFSSAASVKKMGGYSLGVIIKVVAKMYNDWEGNYAGHFLWAAINPILIGNTGVTVRCFNVFAFCIFVSIWFWIIYNVCKLYLIDKEHRILITMIILLISMNCRFLKELLAWFTGTVYYTLTFLAGLAGIVILIKDNSRTSKIDKKSIVPIITICLCDIWGVGGVLQIAALLCWCNLIYTISTFVEKKGQCKALIGMGVTLIATFVNLLAPGYYIRKNNYESISIIKAVFYAIICVLKEIKRICTETYLPYAFLAIFIFLFFVIKEQRKKFYSNPFVVVIVWLFGIIISVVPVCYGYGSWKIASRGYEILDLCIVLGMFMLLCSLVYWLKHVGIELTKNMIFILATSAVFLLFTNSIGNIEMSDIPCVQCIAGLADGSIKDYSDYWRGILNTVEYSEKGSDLIIDVDAVYLDMDCIIDRLGIQEDPSNWVNIAIADYYGYQSVAINRKE